MNPRPLVVLALLVLLNLTCATAQKHAKDDPKPEVQKHAEALLDRARQLSDIRSPKAPPFRLKATFSFIGDDLETINGTYTEVWLSQDQWRREATVGEMQKTEIAGPGKLWRLDKPQDFPEKPERIFLLMGVLPMSSAQFAFESVTENSSTNPPADCAITKPDSWHSRSSFCFDHKSGLLFRSAFPHVRPMNIVNYSCLYGTFRKFGDYWFPREMACFEDRHKVIEAKVVDLIPESSTDPSLFIPPPGAEETDRCSSVMKPPVAVSSSSPFLPFGTQESKTVTLSLEVDDKGKPQNVRVRQSGTKNLDELAVRAVRGWRFKPATCAGTPITTPITVEVEFHANR